MAADSTLGQIANLIQHNTLLAQENAALARRLLDAYERQNGERPPLKTRERNVIRAIGTGRLIAKQIARSLDVECTKSFQCFLSDMVRFRRLENNGDGYAVRPEYRDVATENEEEDEAVA